MCPSMPMMQRWPRWDVPRLLQLLSLHIGVLEPPRRIPGCPPTPQGAELMGNVVSCPPGSLRVQPGIISSSCCCCQLRLTLGLSFQIVKALEHLHSKLSVIHRGECQAHTALPQPAKGSQKPKIPQIKWALESRNTPQHPMTCSKPRQRGWLLCAH